MMHSSEVGGGTQPCGGFMALLFVRTIKCGISSFMFLHRSDLNYVEQGRCTIHFALYRKA
jgi:hypothetical protein